MEEEKSQKKEKTKINEIYEQNMKVMEKRLKIKPA